MSHPQTFLTRALASIGHLSQISQTLYTDAITYQQNLFGQQKLILKQQNKIMDTLSQEQFLIKIYIYIYILYIYSIYIYI